MEKQSRDYQLLEASRREPSLQKKRALLDATSAPSWVNTVGGLNMDLPPGASTWASPGSPESQGAQQVDALTQAALRSRMGAMGAQMFGGNIVDESSRQFWDQYAQTGVQPESYARWMLRKSGSPDFVPS